MASKKLHVNVLRKNAAKSAARIQRALTASLKELARLEKFLVRPGWTTPAEFRLVDAGIASAAARADALAADLSELVGAAGTVGRPSGVVIIEG